MRSSDDKFWLLEGHDRSYADWDEGMYWRREDYPDSAGEGPYVGFGGPSNRQTELRIKLVTTRTPDFILTIGDLLVQDRVANMMREQGFTGFELRPASVRWKVRKPDFDPAYDDDETPGISVRDALELQPPTYWEVFVAGWGGVAPPESGMTPPLPGTRKWEGIGDWSRMVDRNQWNGSDLFFVWPFPLCRFVTERVAMFIKKNKLTGVKVIRQDKYHPSHQIAGAMPGRLRSWLPEARAREIGEPLGIY